LEVKVAEKRGPKSLGDLSVVMMDARSGRPEPPPEVRRREAEIWRSIVDSMPRNWFGKETWSLLKGFCKHSFAAEKFGERYTELLEAGPPEAGAGVAIYWETIDKLGDLYGRETRAISNLSVRLRIAKLQRQRIEKDEAAIRNTPQRRMWEGK
jgi:hypothetical protein